MPRNTQRPDSAAQLLPQRCLTNGRPQTAPHSSHSRGHRPAADAGCLHGPHDARPQSAAASTAQPDASTAGNTPTATAGATLPCRRVKRPQSAAGALQKGTQSSTKSRPSTARSSALDAPLHATNPALARLRQQLAGLAKLTPVTLACLDDAPVTVTGIGAAASSGVSNAGGLTEAGQPWKDVEEMTAQEVAFTYGQARQAAATAVRAAGLRRGGKSRRLRVSCEAGSWDGVGPSCPASPDARRWVHTWRVESGLTTNLVVVVDSLQAFSSVAWH